MANRNQVRRQNYRRLREAGFSAKEADRVKGSSSEYINKVVKNKKLPPVNPIKQAASFRKPSSTIPAKTLEKYARELKKHQRAVKAKPKIILGIAPEPMKGRITYQPVSAMTYDYQSRYSYLMAFQVRHPDGVTYEWKYVTLVSYDPKTKEQLKEEVKEYVFADKQNQSKYDSTPLVSTIVLVEAYKRDSGLAIDWKRKHTQALQDAGAKR